MPDYKLISADSHAEDPSKIYHRLSPEYRDRAPRIETINGGHYLVNEGQKPIRVDLTAKLLTDEDKRREFRGGQVKAQGGDEAFTDIQARLTDQDEDGVSAEVVYSNEIFRIFASPDPGYQMAFCRLYNDLYTELFKDNLDRFVPAATAPVVDIRAAIEEVKRAAKLGFRTINIPVSMPSLPYNRPDYEPLWSAVEDADLILSFHSMTVGENEIIDDLGEADPQGTDLIYMAMTISEARSTLVNLTASGVLQRHPSLKFVLAEAGIGWIAWYLILMDEYYEKRHMWHTKKLDMLPSEYFKRQGYATFSIDPVGLRNRDITGVDGLMWGSDYPHDEGTFPRSRQAVEDMMKDIPEDEARKIAGGNAAALYGLSL